MGFIDEHRYYMDALRRDPATPRPILEPGTVEGLHAWKRKMRAYDQALMELGRVTPAELQAKNAVRIPPGTRIVKFAQFV